MDQVFGVRRGDLRHQLAEPELNATIDVGVDGDGPRHRHDPGASSPPAA
jgi:hypothetical protein